MVCFVNTCPLDSDLSAPVDRIQPSNNQARVVRKVDNAIHRINHYPVDSVVCFVKAGVHVNLSEILVSLKTGGDNSNKRCFGTKPKLFRESGDFSGNRDT